MLSDQSIGPYQLIEEIGRGGFAVVYRALDQKMGREVAVKLIFSNHAADPAFVERFQQEARTAAQLRHPGLVRIYDFDELDGQLYLAMELIPGPHLGHLLVERGPLPLEEALPLLSQLAEALDYLHRRQVVHRDLKPANVLLEGEHPDWRVTLADFGLVRSLEQSAQFTQSGGSLGTPAYFAPEQAAPDKWGEISPLTDVYALGVLTFELLLGRRPFEGDPHALVHAHAYVPVGQTEAYRVDVRPLEFGDSVPLRLSLTYQDAQEQRYTHELTLYLNVVREGTEPQPVQPVTVQVGGVQISHLVNSQLELGDITGSVQAGGDLDVGPRLSDDP